MLIWTSSISIWKKPNRVLLASHRLRSSGSLHWQTILKIWLRRSKGFGRVFGVSLFSQWECYSPVLEFLFLWSDNIDGLPLYMLQDGIILQGSPLVYTRNRHKKPPWPGDFKRWMRVIHSELKIWYVHVPFILFMPITFFQDSVVLIVTVKKVKVCCQAMSSLSDTRVLLFSEELMETISLSENKIQRNGGERLGTRSLKIFLQQNKSKILLYWSQSKRISMSWTVTKEHVISCSGSVWDGLRCNRWIASNDLFREKCLLTTVESHKKDHTRPRTKRRKTSESAYPTNVLGSIVLTLSLFKILNNNMFVVIYVSCYQLH
uniref:Uncharacterized protein n=1 Tax=Brassica campestris TaxID=3711 RepID=A0A3P6BNA9_BRACM|nr:unnamed protein product [Brassica rapa]